MLRRADLALALVALSGCLSAQRQDRPGDDPDAAVDPAGDAGADATPIPSCAERLPQIASVEHPATRHCYFIGGTVDAYDAATEECEVVGAHALQLADQDEADFVAKELLPPDASWWIGLRLGKTPETWTWVTGEELGAWNDWGGPPNGDGICVELLTDPLGQCEDGCWNDLDCEEHAKATLCELEP